MSIAYFVHDLNDPAVARRVAMFGAGGGAVDLFGFHRGATGVGAVSARRVHDFGRTRDGKFLQRILAVVARRLDLGRWGPALAGAKAIVARNLEMLVLAAAARRRYAPGVPLHYEVLDIHRLVCGTGLAARLLRGLEARLMRDCAGIIVSSPAFERAYLRRWHTALPPIRLIENKVMPAPGQLRPPAVPRPPGPPWRIGWFGAIRCRRSLLCLADLARRHPGLIEVDIRGRVTEAVGQDFHRIVDETPALTYHGAYRYQEDLAEIYRQVHFSWAIDFFESGLNSTWLLPNRLYEGAWCGAVPVAMANVETGKWLAERGLGVTFLDPLEQSALKFFSEMTCSRFETLWRDISCAEEDMLACTEPEIASLSDFLHNSTLETP
jgi:succinoglycan biosynthesis protein ExoL